MVTPSQAMLKEAGFDDDVIEEQPAVPEAVGCKACGDTGYRGRIAIHEVMPVTEEIERMCVERASSEDIKKLAIKQGMITLREDGLQKVLRGVTTIEEIARVIV